MISGNQKFIFVSHYTWENFQFSINSIRSTRSFNAFFERVSKRAHTAENKLNDKSDSSQKPPFSGLQDFIERMKKGEYEYWIIEKGEIESYDEKKYSSFGSFLEIAKEDATIGNDESPKKRELAGYYLLKTTENQLTPVKKYLDISVGKSMEKFIEKNLKIEKGLGLLYCVEINYNTNEIYIRASQQAWACIISGRIVSCGILIVFFCSATGTVILGVGLIIGSVLTAIASIGLIIGGFYYRSIAAENQRIIQKLYYKELEVLYDKEQKNNIPKFYTKITSLLPTLFKHSPEKKENNISISKIVSEIEESNMTTRNKNNLYNSIQRQIQPK